MLNSFVFTLAQAAKSGPGGLADLLPPILCFGVIVYFMIIRPQQKRQKDLQKLVSSLKKGDRVVTNGGIHGTIAYVKDGPTVSVLVAEGVKLEIDKAAISTIESNGATAAPATLPAKS